MVLVEGPRSFTPHIPLLTHPQAQMPLAVYAYAVRSRSGHEDERWSAYYPFCDYSPELVALQEAAAAGSRPASSTSTSPSSASWHRRWRRPRGRRSRRPGPVSPCWTSTISSTAERLQALAEQLGCRDQEDLWEHLFEADLGRVGAAEHVARDHGVLRARAPGPHPRPSSTVDGTTAREAEMVWHVREALSGRAPGDGPVLVVVGGFHAVALPDLLADPPARPQVSLDRR